MQDIRYHVANVCATLFFAYTLAAGVNQIVEYSLTPDQIMGSSKKTSRVRSYNDQKKEVDIQKILDSQAFLLADPAAETVEPSKEEKPAIEEVSDLILLGTITGPASIARALIKKKSEKEPQIFRLWKNVYGYKLIRINNFKVYLKSGEKIHMLDMYAEKDANSRDSRRQPDNRKTSGTLHNRTLSRSEMQQQMKNMDTMLKGLRAGPYRVNGKIEGYKLIKIRPNNMLYKLGARSGDVIRRINGHPIDSTEKLYKMWQSLPHESKVVIDIQRGQKIETFDFNFTD